MTSKFNSQYKVYVYSALDASAEKVLHRIDLNQPGIENYSFLSFQEHDESKDSANHQEHIEKHVHKAVYVRAVPKSFELTQDNMKGRLSLFSYLIWAGDEKEILSDTELKAFGSSCKDIPNNPDKILVAFVFS